MSVTNEKLSDLIKKEVELLSEKEIIEKGYAANIKIINSELKEVRENKELYGAGLDLDKIILAKSVIAIRGEIQNDSKGRRSEVVQSAIRDIATNNAGKIKAKYFGVKNYSGFGDQQEDHSYGMGPKHGNIVFSVGLKNDARAREPFLLTDDEMEASLYYLQNLKAIQEYTN